MGEPFVTYIYHVFSSSRLALFYKIYCIQSLHIGIIKKKKLIKEQKSVCKFKLRFSLRRLLRYYEYKQSLYYSINVYLVDKISSNFFLLLPFIPSNYEVKERKKSIQS